MASPGDRINPVDALMTALSKGPSPEDLPGEMICPSNHRTVKFLITCGLESEPPETYRTIPVWVCPDCVVAYRFQECRMVPGTEGLA